MAILGPKESGEILEPIDGFLASSRNRSAMLQDVESGRRTEIEAFNGEAVRRAETLGIDAPLNLALASLIRAI